MIYELVFVSPWKDCFMDRSPVSLPMKRSAPTPGSGQGGSQILYVNVLRTSEAIYEEAWPIVPQKNNLVTGYGDLLYECAKLPERSCRKDSFRISKELSSIGQGNIVCDYGPHKLVKQSEHVVTVEDKSTTTPA